MIIYKLTFPNGKAYIGQTVKTMEHRFAQHGRRSRANSLLPVHCAWRKHGSPSVEVLGSYESMEALHEAEIAAIREYDCLAPKGYNLGYGGETSPAKNPIVAAKISAKALGREVTTEARSKISSAFVERWKDPEYRAKVDAGVKASWTPERRAAAAERTRLRRGEKRSEQAKANMRGRQVSDETRAKMSAAAKGKKKAPRSAETRAKLAESAKRQWTDPAIAARRGEAISAALKAKFAALTNEQRAALSEVKKQAWVTRRANKE